MLGSKKKAQNKADIATMSEVFTGLPLCPPTTTTAGSFDSRRA
jgi:hypothetical protein